MDTQQLEKLAKLIRYFILISTTKAGSGHPTSSLSAADLMAVLFFGGFFRFDEKNPSLPFNDCLIFSKGHASPLFYALWAAAGAIEEKELLTLRQFGSRLEGHPTMAFPYTEAATGSLGQGLSVGVGMALNAKYVDKLPYRTYVLLGDSEMAEGSQWEALACAAHYKLGNLIGILDVNRLGQRGETMYRDDVGAYQKRIEAFGWETILIDGHNISEINFAYEKARASKEKPLMVIAKTLKGKGVSFIEDKDGWHGRALSVEELERALQELGEVDNSLRGKIALPQKAQTKNSKLTYERSEGAAKAGSQNYKVKLKSLEYSKDQSVATRKAYGNALVKLFPKFPNMVVLDAETSNSTFAETFRKEYPERFFEMYIAEQNMAGVALGFSRRGKIPFVSTFAAFFARAFDQIRMSQYSDANIKFVGSHAGISIGEDGASQMGLEDIAMFRALLKSVVLYPSDAVSTERLIEKSARHHGVVYIRTTRKDTPILYDAGEAFPIGKSKTLRESGKDEVTIIAAGITLHEALAAHEELQKEGIAARVIDLYSVKPLDEAVIRKAATETKAIITVEDHYPEGGIGEAVRGVFEKSPVPIHSLAVRKMPRSGKPQELLDYEEISKTAIVKKVEEILSASQSLLA